MSRTVTALYDTRQEAEAARGRLGSAVALERVNIIDKGSGGSGGGGLGQVYMSNDDRQAYGEGLRRGGFLLCAEVESGEEADKIVRLLEESPGVDMDERQRSWRSEGWAPSAGATGGAGTSQAVAGSSAQSGHVVEEERIPIVEEELRVGKREVERGGARVRSYVREVPVHEEVTLREEHVQVERRPVDQQASGAAGGVQQAGDMLQDREMEMRETAEEPVVQKVAAVREEVVVRKTAEERTEQIDETVRHTEVEVDEGAGDRSAFGSFGNNDRESGGTGSGSEAARTDRERDPTR
jgi:uncharacterized protein (TIGR02271 family)